MAVMKRKLSRGIGLTMGHKALTDKELLRIRRLIEAGLSFRETARALQCNHETIVRRLSRRGVTVETLLVAAHPEVQALLEADREAVSRAA